MKKALTKSTLLLFLGIVIIVSMLYGCTAATLTPDPTPLQSSTVQLPDLNERWAGARCRIRVDVPIKKGRDSKGWSGSPWIIPRSEYKKGLTGGLLKVSNRNSLPNGRVSRGTAFIAEGWGFENPKSKSGLILRLRFADGSGLAKMSFHGAFGFDLGAKHAMAMERWARMELFQLSAADEKLLDVPRSKAVAVPRELPSPVPTPTISPRPPGPAGSSVSDRALFDLRLIGVAVEPLRIAPGGEIGLVVTYSVDGVPAGQSVDVVERRAILSKGRVLTTLQARLRRQPGTHKSRQPLRVPPDLEEGIYELQVTVEARGVSVEKSAIFQVMSPGG